MKQWTDDEDLFSLVRQQLFTAVVGDVMDKAGLQHQFLPPTIKPLQQAMVVIGRAMPVLEMDVFTESFTGGTNPLMQEPFGLLFRALDDLKSQEVYVCTGASPRYALWGELMSVRASMLGAAGAIVDGYSRDTRGIVSRNFPTFSYGGYAQDQGPRGKVVDFRVPLEIGQVRINPGDLIFGDLDGVCVIPQAMEKDIIQLALQKVQGENQVLHTLKSGMSSYDAFKLHGIM